MPRAIFLAALIACAVAVFAPGTPRRGALAEQTTGCWPARPNAAGSASASIETADGTRTYLLHVPATYNGADAVPLVLGFHGLSSNGAAMEEGSQLSARADRPDGGFIVVYPQGLVATLLATHFNNWQLPSPEPDDVAFVSQLLDSLESQLCIDVSRVYATGLSNGAMMSTRLACSLSARIAAVGLVAGAYYPPQSDTINGAETCPDTRPVPVIAFHGTADTGIPFDGGGFLTARLPIDSTTAENVMGDWAAHDNCTSGRQESRVDTEVRLVQYDNCDNSANLKLYVVDGGGHTWPGAADVPSLGYTTHQISATDLIWQFFQGYSLSSSPLPDTDGDGIPDMYDLDNDKDGCPDVAEVQAAPGSETHGGRRDPNNPWDYFNPTHDGKNRVDDILAVVQHFGKNAGDPGYSTDYDRTPLGPNRWNLGPPDGKIRIADILAIVAQFGHDCS